ncbi:hypothetical protein PIB30_080766 [Stylosanthes scabra]|uniref:Uncharacterized protein n=1 Tax=Stylosanthes scabra TaxID=79078 RepID=A0ABU6ZQT6_9FABA|nr:hypothetical protein [Stylosanthes scabra]
MTKRVEKEMKIHRKTHVNACAVIFQGEARVSKSDGILAEFRIVKSASSFWRIKYPGEEDAVNCMRIDAIDMLIKEVQEEDNLLKAQANSQERLDAFENTNHESVLQKNKDATLKEKQTIELKPLPNTLKYAFLGNDKDLPVIISSSLTTE